MAEAVLTLRMNARTGERTLIIHYESESDALAYEHEDDHRSFVESILGQPLNEVADRLEVKRAPPPPLTQTSPAPHVECQTEEPTHQAPERERS